MTRATRARATDSFPCTSITSPCTPYLRTSSVAIGVGLTRIGESAAKGRPRGVCCALAGASRADPPGELRRHPDEGSDPLDPRWHEWLSQPSFQAPRCVQGLQVCLTRVRVILSRHSPLHVNGQPELLSVRIAR